MGDSDLRKRVPRFRPASSMISIVSICIPLLVNQNHLRRLRHRGTQGMGKARGITVQFPLNDNVEHLCIVHDLDGIFHRNNVGRLLPY